MCKVSILVPIYGVEKYIERCARSLFEQTYSDLEFVFVNDCTPDKSMEILQRVMEDYPERKDSVRIIGHETNRGLAAARNTALDNATGEFIIIVDSDDWMELNAVELLIKKQREKDACVVYGSMMVHYENEDSVMQGRKYCDKQDMVLQMMKRSWDHCLAGKLLRSRLFAATDIRWIEGLNMAEDRYMMTVLAYQADSFVPINEVVYHYDLRNEGSITKSGNSRQKAIRNNAQELQNVLALENFFKNKEHVYIVECARCVVEQMEINMKVALAYGEKDEFYKIVDMLDGRGEVELASIGWGKKGLKAFFQHNYSCMWVKRQKDRAVHFVEKHIGV